MPITVHLDRLLMERDMSVTEGVGITLPNLSILKNNRVRAVRFSTLEALCRVLDCQPGDILEYTPEASRRK